MKKIPVIFIVITLILLNAAVLMAGGKKDSGAIGKNEYPFTGKTLIQIVDKHKEVSFIAEALEKTGLADQMAHMEGYTLFVPTDDIIARLHESVRKAMMNDPQVLLEILTDQMVKGVLTAEELRKMNSVTTMGEVKMAVGRRGTKITLSDSDLIVTDLFGKGFIVHIVTGIIVSGIKLKS
ncbi:MAG: fasciclin domain-containing protein [Spirochaetales bacterium]|nr:fasciclin domain-containing protein [Spirochaetales bacterium]